LFQPKPHSAIFVGPGSGQLDGEPLAFMPMPRDLSTARAPALPAPGVLATQVGALGALRAALSALERRLSREAVEPIELGALTDGERLLVSQLLGEGEVAAVVSGDLGARAHESIYAGVWRVLHRDAGMRDTIEVGGFPRSIVAAARADGRALAPPAAIAPEGTMNAPALIEELRARARAWQSGRTNGAAHVINLSLLPLTPGDGLYLEQQLGRGRVMVLSRGYGNCRIINTQVAGVWRVTYFNSQDAVILDTLEVGDVPEVACAARQDLEDSAERLAELLQWVGGA